MLKTKLNVIPIPTPFPVGPVNVFLWRDDPLTLIDAGVCTEDAWDALQEGLQALGVAVNELQRVLLTHHHVDHIGLLPHILAESEVEVCGHPDIEAYSALVNEPAAPQRRFRDNLLHELGVPESIRADMMRHWDLAKPLLHAIRLDTKFEDGQPLGAFTPYFVPGHSATDTLTVNHEEGFAIAGDHLLEKINPNPLLRRPLVEGAPRQKALVEYRASLERTRSLDLGLCYPGHGEPFADYSKVIDGILHQHTRRNQLILKKVKDRWVTAYDVASLLYPQHRLGEFYLCLSVAMGQLEVLADSGQMKEERRDGVLFFKKAIEQE